MALRIPRLDSSIPIVNENGTPALVFIQWWDTVASRIEASVGSIEDALAAAGIAQAAAEVAQAAAETAQSAAEGAGAVSKLSGSGISGATITASDAGSSASISISSHTRVYSDGSSVSVNGGTLTGLAYSTTYYVYYDDADFSGGAVTYVSTTTQATAAQTGVRHLVTQVTTPAAAAPPENGLRPAPPGFGTLEEQ